MDQIDRLLGVPEWHRHPIRRARYVFYCLRAKRRLARQTEERCAHGCCVRWLDKRGNETGGINPVPNPNHFAAPTSVFRPGDGGSPIPIYPTSVTETENEHE